MWMWTSTWARINVVFPDRNRTARMATSSTRLILGRCVTKACIIGGTRLKDSIMAVNKCGATRRGSTRGLEFFKIRARCRWWRQWRRVWCVHVGVVRCACCVSGTSWRRRGRVWIFSPFCDLPTGGSDSVGYGGSLMECGIKVRDLSTCHVAL